MDLDYDYITTKDLEKILENLRKIRYRVQPYRIDPLRIENAKLGDSWIEIVFDLLVGAKAGIEILKYVREQISEPYKEKIERRVRKRKNLKTIDAEFETEEEENISWKVPQDDS